MYLCIHIHACMNAHLCMYICIQIDINSCTFTAMYVLVRVCTRISYACTHREQVARTRPSSVSAPINIHGSHIELSHVLSCDMWIRVKSYLWMFHLLTPIFGGHAYTYATITHKHKSCPVIWYTWMSVKSYLWRIHLLTPIFCGRAYKYSMIRPKNKSFDIHRWVSSHTCEWLISWRPPSVGAPIIIQWSNIKMSHALSFDTHRWVSSHTYEWFIA